MEHDTAGTFMDEVVGMTNADRIRAMTDEELAQYRADILCQLLDELNDKCYEKFKYSREQFVKGYLDWLKQEVSDNG